MRLFRCTCLIVVIACPGQVAGMTCPQLAGEWSCGGPTDAVAVQGDTVYFGNGRSLMIADVTDPTAPVILNELPLTGLPRDIVVSGNYLYLHYSGISQDGILIFDVSEPLHPCQVSTIQGRHTEFAVVDDHLYSIGYHFLKVLDVHDPANPIEIAILAIDSILALGVSDEYAYLLYAASGNELTSGIIVVDISDPANPSRVGNTGPCFYACFTMAASGDRVYVAEESELSVVDVGDPQNPHKIGSVPLSAAGLTVSGRYLYVSNNWGLHIVDTADAAGAVAVGALGLPGKTAYDVAISGNHVYVADYTGMRVIDVTDATNPYLASQVITSGYPSHIVASGTYAYLAADWGSLRVLDVSNTANVREVARVDTPGVATDFAFNDDIIYIAGSSSDYVIDISDPLAPCLACSFSTGGYKENIAMSENHVFLAGNGIGLKIVDVSDPTNPVASASLNRIEAHDVALSDSNAFVITAAGLRVFDVSNPTSPYQIGLYQLDNSWREWQVEIGRDGEHAYLGVDEKILVLDIHDAANPRLLCTYEHPISIKQFAVSDHHLYCLSRVAGVHRLSVIDFRLPHDPIPSSDADVPSAADIFVADGHAYLASFASSCLVAVDLRCTAPNASFSWTPTRPASGRTIGFSDRSDGDPTAWTWEFGDGSTNMTQNPTHSYARPGFYAVTLTVENSSGSDAMTRTIEVTAKVRKPSGRVR